MSIDAPPPPPPPPPPRDEPIADQVDLPIVEDVPTPQDTGSPSGRPGNTDGASAPLSPATDAGPRHTADMETQGSELVQPGHILCRPGRPADRGRHRAALP